MAWGVFMAIMFLLMILIVATNKEPPILTELKRRHQELLKILTTRNDPMWNGVLKLSIITGMFGWSKDKGPIGSNVNKGYEIYICLDGNDVNSAMYVLIHELAHMSVPEYDHTDNYWDNFEKLKNICIENNLYTPVGNQTYCGDLITDTHQKSK